MRLWSVNLLDSKNMNTYLNSANWAMPVIEIQRCKCKIPMPFP